VTKTMSSNTRVGTRSADHLAVQYERIFLSKREAKNGKMAKNYETQEDNEEKTNWQCSA
jgi:hypothetical protein